LSRFRRYGCSALRDEWMELDAYADKAVALRVPDARVVSGVSAGVDETGAFLLRDHLGALNAFSGGEISLRLERHAR